MVEAFGMTYGQEHVDERHIAREKLFGKHENDKHRMPKAEMERDWEELHWR